MEPRRPQDGRRTLQGVKTARNRPQRASVPFFRTSPRLWFLDLDDTLVASSAGLLHEVHLRMNDFLMNRLGMSEEKADVVRERYWREYGSTFIGLWRHYGVDPREFLPLVHDFDYEPYLLELGSIRSQLAKLPGRKVLFTNGPRTYAQKIIPALGLDHFFDAVVTSTDMRMFGDWRPKPSSEMLRAVCARLRADPRDAVLVDDSLLNLKAAKRAGLRTVWCVGMRRKHARLAVPGGAAFSHPAVDRVVNCVAQLVRSADSF